MKDLQFQLLKTPEQRRRLELEKDGRGGRPPSPT